MVLVQKVGCIVGAADVGAADVGADVEVGSRYVSIPGCVTLSLYPVKGLMLGDCQTSQSP